MLKKVSLLLLVLVLPAGIYLFLREFGSNGYEVPVYQTVDPAGCGIKDWNFALHVSHRLAGRQPDRSASDTYKIVGFLMEETDSKDGAGYILNLTRAYDALFDIEDVWFVTVVSPSFSNDSMQTAFIDERDKILPNPGKWHIANTMEKAAYEAFIECGLGFGDGKKLSAFDLVLIDKQNRIRGYYDGVDYNEVERMIIEARILIRNAGI